MAPWAKQQRADCCCPSPQHGSKVKKSVGGSESAVPCDKAVSRSRSRGASSLPDEIGVMSRWMPYAGHGSSTYSPPRRLAGREVVGKTRRALLTD